MTAHAAVAGAEQKRCMFLGRHGLTSGPDSGS